MTDDPLRVFASLDDVAIARGYANSWEPDQVRIHPHELDDAIAALTRLRDAGINDTTGHVAGCSCMDCVVYMR